MNIKDKLRVHYFYSDSEALLAQDAIDFITELEKQLAAAQLQIKTLREALEYLLTCKHGEFCDHYRDAERKANHALSAPQDLSALRARDKRIADEVEPLVKAKAEMLSILIDLHKELAMSSRPSMEIQCRINSALAAFKGEQK